MSYDKGREALRSEAELLARLGSVAAEHAGTIPNEAGAAAVIAKGWAGTFSSLCELNKELAAADDETFRETLSKEKELLQGFLKVATQSRGFGESWAASFQEDIEIIDGLLSS